MLTTFPTQLVPGYSLFKSPRFETGIINYGNRIEQRIAMNSLEQNVLKMRWDTYNSYTMAVLRKFFLARKGKLQAFYLQAFIETTGGAVWLPNQQWEVEDIIRPVVANGRSYKCTVAGVGSGVELAWPTTVGGTVADGAATWKENTYTVRFDVDAIDLERFTYDFWRTGMVELVEVDA